MVLAGPGHRLYPLVDESHTTQVPKALLPIANRPMVCWTIDWLLLNQVQAITVVVDSRSFSKVNHALMRAFPGLGGQLSVHMMGEHQGTVGVLLDLGEKASAKEQTNFLFVPCDLCVRWDGLLSQMADMHRISKADLTCLFVPDNLLSCKADDDSSDADDRGDSVIVGIDDRTNQLVYYAAKADVEGDNVVALRTGTMLKHPQVSLRLDLVDVHCYITSRDFLTKCALLRRPELFSFREEVLPALVNPSSSSKTSLDQQSLRIQPFILKPNESGDRQSDDYCLRANSICSYLLANRTLAKQFNDTRVPGTCELGAKAQVGQYSLVGEHCRIGERTIVKRSVVGPHANIGTNVKITNSVVLDQCVIEDNVKLDGCVVGSKVVIKEKVSLKGCEVASQFTVEAGMSIKGEVLGASRELQEMFD